jgi:hypothetical protein
MATASPKLIPALRITSRSPMGAFRRAGRTWVPEASVVAVNAFKKAEIELLKAEPMLVVTEVEVPESDLVDSAAEAAE